METKIGVGTWACSPEERRLINEVLDSGQLSHGPKCKELERQFSSLHGCSYGVLSNSGTSSLHVAVQALKEIHGWDDGDEVIIPAVTFVATANVVIHNRLRPVLVDVNPWSYNIEDLAPVAQALHDNNHVRAIIPVHLFGQPANLSGILGVTSISGRNISIIEDSCECMFATHLGRPVGSWGDIGCFSFYVAHLLTTGVGGMSITNNPDYAAKMRSLVNHGRDGIYLSSGDDDGITGADLHEVMSRRFCFESVGHSFRITELEAALGLGQLLAWQDMIATRRMNAEYMISGLQFLGDHRIRVPEIMKGNTHSFMMLPLVAGPAAGDDKWELCRYLEDYGIETREMLPLTNQPVYCGLWNPNDYPVADWINRYGFYVACHQGLTKAHMDYIVEVICDFFVDK